MSELVAFVNGDRELWVSPAHVVSIEHAGPDMAWIAMTAGRRYLVHVSAVEAAQRITDAWVF